VGVVKKKQKKKFHKFFFLFTFFLLFIFTLINYDVIFPVFWGRFGIRVWGIVQFTILRVNTAMKKKNFLFDSKKGAFLF